MQHAPCTVRHFIELIDATDSFITQHQGSTFKNLKKNITCENLTIFRCDSKKA